MHSQLEPDNDNFESEIFNFMKPSMSDHGNEAENDVLIEKECIRAPSYIAYNSDWENITDQNDVDVRQSKHDLISQFKTRQTNKY